jgi:hypothetical protein
MTVGEILKTLKLDSNNTLFSEDRRVSGKEFQIEIIWHQDIHSHLFNFLSSALAFPEKNKSDSQTTATADDTNVKLTDCLKEFKQKETLDAENMWYCS